MSPKVVMASRYVDPVAVGANRNVVKQVWSLRKDHDVGVEILTWPLNDLWTGSQPTKEGEVIQEFRAGIPYHVMNPPRRWDVNQNTLPPEDWKAAVEFGEGVLRNLSPDIVHLQHRHGFWWLLESAQRLHIPTVYTNHDWGLACLRTVLVNGKGELCDGTLSESKCEACVLSGRGTLGRANELLVRTELGRRLADVFMDGVLGPALRQKGVLTRPSDMRIGWHFERHRAVLSRLNALFTPSTFGKKFFADLGVDERCIQVLPWYHDPGSTTSSVSPGDPVTISYVGRVSPEKGVDLIFAAMKQLQDMAPLRIQIAGDNDSEYCRRLKALFRDRVGRHEVRWLGWRDVEEVFLSTDAAVMPSRWQDNTPLSMIEALSYQVPVISPRISPVADLLKEGENAFLFDFNSADSLAIAIRRVAQSRDRIRARTPKFDPVMTCTQYSREVAEVYHRICAA